MGIDEGKRCVRLSGDHTEGMCGGADGLNGGRDAVGRGLKGMAHSEG